MDIRDRRALKENATEALRQATYDPRKLVLIHTAILLGAGLLITVLHYILAGQIENTGGLGGLGMRSILSTIQAALQLGLMITTPFWMMGLTYVTLRVARRQSTGPADLKKGFLRFGPVLRLELAQALLYILIGVLCINIGTTIFAFTPFIEPFNEILIKVNEQMAATHSFVMDAATEAALMEAAIPLLVIIGILYLVLVIPMMYRLRMANYAIMDEDCPGAIKAMGISSRLMRGNRFQLFRLDLSFWWFYLLNGLTIMLAYGDTLLSMLGVKLPISPDVLYFACCGLYIAGQLALQWWAGAQVETTYATVYDGLRTKLQPLHREQPQTPPQQNPWGKWQ